MMRLLAAILLTLAFHSTAPVAGTAIPAMPSATVMVGNAQSMGTIESLTACTDGYPCVLGCSACNLIASDRPRDTLTAISDADIRNIIFAGFDLSWRLYRPPKIQWRHPDYRRPTQHKGTHDA